MEPFVQENIYEVVSNQSEEDKQERNYINICHQFYLIGPMDLTGYQNIKDQLNQISAQNFSQDSIIDFISQNMKSFGFSNCRLLHRIKTQYFWGGAAAFMIKTVLKYNHLLSGCINTLNSIQNGIIKLRKVQVFLLLCNMFLGTMPPQLFSLDTSMGKLMSVFEDEDDIHSKKKLDLRLNKLKSIVKYFCIRFKRDSESNQQQNFNPTQFKKQQQRPSKKDQYIIFQRFKTDISQSDLVDDTITLSKINIKEGKYENGEVELNGMAIHSCPTTILGQKIYEDQLELEETLFFAHPQLITLRLLQSDPMTENEVILVYGAEKYLQFDAVSRTKTFNFSQKFKDQSSYHPIHGFINTSFMFVHRGVYPRHQVFDILGDIKKVCCGLEGSKYLLNPDKDRMISGAYKSSLNRTLRTPSDIKFITDWMAASIARWPEFTYYIDDTKKLVDSKIMMKQLELHTIRDILGIIQTFYEVRLEQKVGISLMQYLKRVVL